MMKTEKKTVKRLVSGPQYDFDDLYVTVFNERRNFDADGNVSYKSIKKNFEPTGVRLLDDFLKFMDSHEGGIQIFCRREGILFSELTTLCFLMVGMTAKELKLEWTVERIRELLVYTNMSTDDVARMSGARSKFNLHRICRKFFGCSPLTYRSLERGELDLGRFII